jgi:cobalt-zinc-cadmium efflux system protein
MRYVATVGLNGGEHGTPAPSSRSPGSAPAAEGGHDPPRSHREGHAHAHHHDHAEHHDHGGHAHDHDGHHDHGGLHIHGSNADLTALGIALALTATFMVVEFVASSLLGSLALAADAWHMLSDVGSLGLAAFATTIARRPRSVRNTFGYRRFEILAALANGVLLGVASVLIVREAWSRLWNPPDVQGTGVAIVGAIGLAVNLLSAWFLQAQSAGNMNVRAALAHVMGDALGSCAAIAAGLIVHFLHEERADPALSVLVAGVLLWSAWRVVSEAAHILMEGAPEGIVATEIEREICRVPGVASVHDLHVWSIAAGLPAVTAHIVLAEGAYHGEQIAQAVCALLQRQFGIEHATIQPEPRPPGIVRLGIRSNPPTT